MYRMANDLHFAVWVKESISAWRVVLVDFGIGTGPCAGAKLTGAVSVAVASELGVAKSVVFVFSIPPVGGGALSYSAAFAIRWPDIARVSGILVVPGDHFTS